MSVVAGHNRAHVHRLILVSKDGSVRTTDMSGYLAETLADRAFKEASDDKQTLIAVLLVVHDALSDVPFSEVRAQYPRPSPAKAVAS